MASAPVPGWYSDDVDPDIERLWDGDQWTENTRPRQTPASALREPTRPRVLGWTPLAVLVLVLLLMAMGRLLTR